MKNLLKIGIIGTGVGIRTHLNGFRKFPNAEIYGIVGSNIDRAKYFADTFKIPFFSDSYVELCSHPEIDLICITTPNQFHYKEIECAILNNKHIIAEKPLAMNIDEINKLVFLANKNDKIKIIDHQLRFNPYIIKVKEIIESGTIGRPYFIKIHQQSTGFSDKNIGWNWSFDHKAGGGVRLAMASHLIDLLNYWLKSKMPFSIKGAMDVVTPYRKKGIIEEQVLASSFFSASISFENNLDVHISATASAFSIPRFDFSIYGTDGELHFDLSNKLIGTFSTNRGKQESILVEGVTLDEKENKVSIFSGSFFYLAQKVIPSILDNNYALLNEAAFFKDAIYTQTILDAIYESNLNGLTVKINDGYSSNCIV